MHCLMNALRKATGSKLIPHDSEALLIEVGHSGVSMKYVVI